MAIGRSKPEPSFLTSAGARLMVICVIGTSKLAISQRGANALLTLAHGGIGQADSLEVLVLAPGWAYINFNLNDIGVNSKDCGALGLEEHAGG